MRKKGLCASIKPVQSVSRQLSHINCYWNGHQDTQQQQQQQQLSAQLQNTTKANESGSEASAGASGQEPIIISRWCSLHLLPIKFTSKCRPQGRYPFDRRYGITFPPLGFFIIFFPHFIFFGLCSLGVLFSSMGNLLASCNSVYFVYTGPLRGVITIRSIRSLSLFLSMIHLKSLLECFAHYSQEIIL